VLPSGQTFSPAGPDRSLCPVSPLPPITDPQTLAFENITGPVVDTRDLNHRAFSALLKFVRKVRSVGGIITLNSAYRPPAYQAHLQQVWDKWMQLRNNRSYACQDLRAQVQAEFAHHRLIESQRPVDDSDHTRGLAFDATVVLPRIFRMGRRRVTLSLDKLARFAGLRRPDIRHDPVHFKYVG
jgi:D-alanyl-D-alanine dipeptidase